MRANNPGIWRLLSRAVYDISAYLFGKDGLSTGWGRFRRLRLYSPIRPADYAKSDNPTRSMSKSPNNRRHAAPKGGKPVKQAEPSAPMGCKLVGTVKGTKLWAGDCAAPSELRGTTAEPAARAPTPKTNPPADDE
jgi:hypothetical protein